MGNGPWPMLTPKPCFRIEALAHTNQKHAEIMLAIVSSSQIRTTLYVVYQSNPGLFIWLKYETIASWYN